MLPVLLLMSCDPGASRSAAQPRSFRDSISYVLGVSAARPFQRDEADLNLELFFSGFEDLLADSSRLRFSRAEQERIIRKFQDSMQARFLDRMAKLAVENEIQERKFLEENRKRTGVIELPSGLQYRVLQSGTGASPRPDNVVRVNYTGKFLDGTIFDSSVLAGKPAEFVVKTMIPGWTEALQLMKPGDTWELIVPADLAYGEAGYQNQAIRIPPNATLVFEMELLEIVR
ncbi:MAG: FKBP-type peptidyl-prolyl cis-trans isomerase [Bacteroidia bacterium]|nr:FKBP-type peptidyl-prolyl cis-trans isomerase [Bacteroidia bacterium]